MTGSGSRLWPIIIERIGPDNWERLQAKYAGAPVYIPQRPTAELRDLIGPSADTLCALCGGDYLTLPLYRDQRRAIGIGLIDSGLPVVRVARMLGVHDRTVRNWVAKLRRNE